MCHLANNVLSKLQVQWWQERGPRWSHHREAGRKGEAHVKHQQVKNLEGWPWQLGLQVLQHATCAIWGPRRKLSRSRGMLEGDVYCSNAMHSLLATELVFEWLSYAWCNWATFVALWNASSTFLVNYKKVFWVRKGVFGVCLTFYIIIIVINKEKIYSIFQTPPRYYVPLNLVCSFILREGWIP